MTTRLERVITAIQAKVQALEPALRSAPDQPIENVSAFPFGTTLIRRVEYSQQSGSLRTGLHTAVVQIHIARKDLPRDIVKAMPYGETLPVALLNDLTLSGAVSHVGPVRGVFKAMEWGDQETIGWEFEIDFKLINQGME
jgi:hypothetical protein